MWIGPSELPCQEGSVELPVISLLQLQSLSLSIPLHQTFEDWIPFHDRQILPSAAARGTPCLHLWVLGLKADRQ